MNYCLRQKDQKRHAVKALKSLNYSVTAIGDSYNDISMLTEADHGIFFRPTKKIADEYPEFLVTDKFETLKKELEQLK